MARLQKPAVLLLGYYGAGNLGDDAILGVTLEGLRAEFPRMHAVVPGEDPEGLAQRYHVRSYPWKDVAALVSSIQEADLVVIGGGGLLHDYWRPQPETQLTPAHFGLTYYCGMGWLAGELGKPVVLYAAGVGPLLYGESRDLVRAVAKAACAITVRDPASKQVLGTLGIPSAKVEVTADPGWLVQPAEPLLVENTLRKAGFSSSAWIGVALRNWDVNVSQELWEQEVITAIRELAHRHALGVVFLPFQHMGAKLQNDVGLAERLARELEDVPTVIMRDPFSPSLMRAFAGQARIMLGMRYHSVLFAAVAGTPTVALAYDPKVFHLAQTLGASVEALSLDGIEAGAIVTAAEAVLAVSAGQGGVSSEIVARQRSSALRNIECLTEILRDPPALVPSAKAAQIAADVIETERLAEACGTTSLWIERVFSDREQKTGTGEETPGARVKARRVVRLVTTSFFDPDGLAVYAGGAERYAMELIGIIRELGWDAEIVQPASGEGWERTYRGVPVRGLGHCPDPLAVGRESERRLEDVPLTIYHAFFVAGDAECTSPALGISHGIYWDDPFWASDPKRHGQLRDQALEAVRRLDLVVSVDANTINWVRSEDPELAEKMVRIPNFVDLDEFQCKPHVTSEAPVILYPRRLCAARGYWLLAAIVPSLLERHRDLEIHFIGDADAREAEHVQRLVTQFSGSVTWERVLPERMREAYEPASIVVIPTVAAEGTSLSLLEAQACGKPVITTAVGGLVDLVIDGLNAQVIAPSPAALEDAIEMLLNDRQLALHLAEGAITTVQQFSKQRWQSRWWRVLRTYLMPGFNLEESERRSIRGERV